jgi:hypothetical protein
VALVDYDNSASIYSSTFNVSLLIVDADLHHVALAALTERCCFFMHVVVDSTNRCASVSASDLRCRIGSSSLSFQRRTSHGWHALLLSNWPLAVVLLSARSVYPREFPRRLVPWADGLGICGKVGGQLLVTGTHSSESQFCAMDRPTAMHVVSHEPLQR